MGRKRQIKGTAEIFVLVVGFNSCPKCKDRIAQTSSKANERVDLVTLSYKTQQITEGIRWDTNTRDIFYHMSSFIAAMKPPA